MYALCFFYQVEKDSFAHLLARAAVSFRLGTHVQGVHFSAVGRVEIFKTLVHRVYKKNTFNEIFVGFFVIFTSK